MRKIMFVCHGNICRSPMAEFVFKQMLKERGIEGEFVVRSSATSREEIGNPVHSGTKRKLAEHAITCNGKVAVQLKPSDYSDYDYLIAMDSNNISNIMRIIGSDPDGKVFRLLDITASGGNIADPWYTGDFDATYQDVVVGCEALLRKILD